MPSKRPPRIYHDARGCYLQKYDTKKKKMKKVRIKHNMTIPALLKLITKTFGVRTNKKSKKSHTYKAKQSVKGLAKEFAEIEKANRALRLATDNPIGGKTKEDLKKTIETQKQLIEEKKEREKRIPRAPPLPAPRAPRAPRGRLARPHSPTIKVPLKQVKAITDAQIKNAKDKIHASDLKAVIDSYRMLTNQDGSLSKKIPSKQMMFNLLREGEILNNQMIGSITNSNPHWGKKEWGSYLRRLRRKPESKPESKPEPKTEPKPAKTPPPPSLEVETFEDLPDVSSDEEEAESEQDGFGRRKNGDGITNHQLDKLMSEWKPHFQGVFALDQLKELNPKPMMSFIMNTAPIKKYYGHWVAVYIDAKKDMSVEYYDPLGDPPPKRFMRDIKRIIDKINPSAYLKMKINKIADQSATSDNCGWFAMKFLVQRYHGIPFRECSGYDDSKNGEKNIKKFMSKYKKFGYI